MEDLQKTGARKQKLDGQAEAAFPFRMPAGTASSPRSHSIPLGRLQGVPLHLPWVHRAPSPLPEETDGRPRDSNSAPESYGQNALTASPRRPCCYEGKFGCI